MRRLGLTRPASADSDEAAGVTHFGGPHDPRAERLPPKLPDSSPRSEQRPENSISGIASSSEPRPGGSGFTAAVRAAGARIPQARSILRAQPFIIAVASGKGGVGKTHLSVNLALALGETGRRVTLIDADAGTPNSDLVLGVEPGWTLGDYLSGRCTRDLLPLAIDPRVRFVAGAASDTGASEEALARAERVRRLAAEFASEQEVVLLDCGAGVGPAVRGPAAAADLLIVVATPEPTSITDAYALIKTVHLVAARSPRIGILINRVDGERQAADVADRLASVTRRFLARSVHTLGGVREDSHVPAALMRRTPFLRHAPRCRAARDVRAIAARLIGMQSSAAAQPVAR